MSIEVRALPAGLLSKGGCPEHRTAYALTWQPSHALQSLGLDVVAEYWRSVVSINDWQKRRFVQTIVGTMFNTVQNKKIAMFGFAFKKDTGASVLPAHCEMPSSSLTSLCCVALFLFPFRVSSPFPSFSFLVSSPALPCQLLFLSPRDPLGPQVVALSMWQCSRMPGLPSRLTRTLSHAPASLPPSEWREDCRHETTLETPMRAGDTRETAAIDVSNGLLKDGALITVYDPKVAEDQVYADLSFEQFEWDHPDSNQVRAAVELSRWGDVRVAPSSLVSLRSKRRAQYRPPFVSLCVGGPIERSRNTLMPLCAGTRGHVLGARPAVPAFVTAEGAVQDGGREEACDRLIRPVRSRQGSSRCADHHRVG